MEVGNAILQGFKNDGYSIVEMLRIAGDVSLLVLADRKQLHKLCIVGIATDYKTSKAKMIKMDIDCLEETLIIKQSTEGIPFNEALNSTLNIIQL